MALGFVRKNLPSWQTPEWQAEAPGLASAWVKWAGEVEWTDSESPDTQFLADETPALGPTGFPQSIGYVPPAMTITKLRVNVRTNAVATNTVQFYLFKNGVATGLNVSYVPGETGVKVSTAVTVAFNGTIDTIDFVAQRSAGATGVIDVAGTADYS
jgi:hypothetical protein